MTLSLLTIAASSLPRARVSMSTTSAIPTSSSSSSCATSLSIALPAMPMAIFGLPTVATKSSNGVQREAVSCRIANCYQFLNRQTRINDLREDENGILWLSTNNIGIVKLDTKKPKLSTTFIVANLPMDHTTRDVSATPDGILWAACGVNGLVRVDMNTHRSKTIPIPHENVLSVLARKDGSVMLGTARRLVRYSPSDDSIEPINFTGEAADSAQRVLVRDMAEDCLGNIWVSTRIGLYKYNGVTFARMSTDEGAHFVFNCSMEDSDGRIWAGSCSGAMVRPTEGDNFRRVGRSWNGRNDEGVLCIIEYNGKIIMGTSDGVKVFDKKTYQEETAEIFKPFNGKVVYSVISDSNGIIWLNTSSGVGYVDFYYGNVYTFTMMILLQRGQRVP